LWDEKHRSGNSQRCRGVRHLLSWQGGEHQNRRSSISYSAKRETALTIFVFTFSTSHLPCLFSLGNVLIGHAEETYMHFVYMNIQ
jgi:hypothetical protein